MAAKRAVTRNTLTYAITGILVIGVLTGGTVSTQSDWNGPKTCVDGSTTSVDGTAPVTDETPTGNGGDLASSDTPYYDGNRTRHPLDPGRTAVTVNTELPNGADVNRRFCSTNATEAFYEHLNEFRRANGLSAVEPRPGLESTARAKSYDLHDRKYFAHHGPDGTTPAGFAEPTVDCHSVFGENLAKTYAGHEMGNSDTIRNSTQLGAYVFQQWKTSPSHRRIMLRNYTTRGFVGTGMYIVSEDHPDEILTVYSTAHFCGDRVPRSPTADPDAG